MHHRHDSTYHDLCYTSHKAQAGTRNSSMGSPWRIGPTTHHTMSECSYHRAPSHSGYYLKSALLAGSFPGSYLHVRNNSTKQHKTDSQDLWTDPCCGQSHWLYQSHWPCQSHWPYQCHWPYQSMWTNKYGFPLNSNFYLWIMCICMKRNMPTPHMVSSWSIHVEMLLSCKYFLITRGSPHPTDPSLDFVPFSTASREFDQQ